MGWEGIKPVERFRDLKLAPGKPCNPCVYKGFVRSTGFAELGQISNEGWSIPFVDIVEFITLSISRVSGGHSIDVGVLPSEITKTIAARVGFEIGKTVVRINENYVRHAQKQHSSDREYKRGQVPIDIFDLGILPVVISKADDIAIDTKSNKVMVIFTANLGYRETMAFELILITNRKRRQDSVLEFHTYYKRKAR